MTPSKAARFTSARSRSVRLGSMSMALSMAVALSASGGCGETSGSRTRGASRSTAGGSEGSVTVGAPAPDIVVQRLNGQPLAMASLHGKVVLLDVWASWCIPCKQELPMLDAIASRWKGRGVEVVAVSVDQERENLDKFLASRSSWSLTVAHDAAGVIADRLRPSKMPTSYIIDRAGIVRSVNSGFVPADASAIEKRLSDLARRP
jgi:cytochrome c biogenesis protein CcmG/thiol:disulfide interchange protein DsbE